MAGQNPSMVIRVAATIAELKANLAEGKSQIETTTAAMTKLAASFSGDRIIQAAHNVTAAVNEIGGVSKLTDAEMARVNSTLEKALDKYRVLGKEAPAGMRELAEATRGATTSGEGLSSWLGKTNGLLAAFGLTLSVGAIVQFGRSVLQAGDAIQKMSDQTGLSLQEVQQLQHIAGQTGTSIDGLVGAVQTLQQRLGDDSTGASGAMRRLRINLTEFNALGPYDQMTTLADAIRAIEDPTERASTAAAIFGGRWREIMPVILSGMRELGDAAPRMSDSAVQAIDRFGDALDRMKTRAIVAGGTVAEFAEKVFALANGDFKQLEMEADGVTDALKKVGPPTEFLTTTTKALGLSAQEAARLERELTASAEESIAVNKEAERAADAYADSIKRLTSAHESAVSALANKLFGFDDIQRAQQYIEALGSVENVSKLSADAQEELARVMTAGRDSMLRAGAGTDELTSKMEAFRLAATQAGRDTAEAMNQIEAEARAAAQAAIDTAAVVASSMTTALDAVDARMAASTMTWGQAMSAVAAGLGTMTGTVQAPTGPEVPYGYNGTFMNLGISGRREFGGPVRGGGSYLVGERGPELFVPGTSGAIVPNGGGMGSVAIHVHVGNFIGSDYTAARQLAGIVKRELEQSLGSQRKLDAA